MISSNAPRTVEIGDYAIECDMISPEQAKILLEQNTQNRPLNLPHVRTLAKQMLSGQWRFTGDPIQIGTSGRVLNGQHRLYAIIESGTSQEMFIMYNIPDESFSVMDTGRNRQASDVLAIAGFSDPRVAAATARMLINYQRMFAVATGQAKKGSNPITHQDILDFMNSVDLRPHINKAMSWYKTQSIYSKAEYAFFYFILGKIDDSKAIQFINAVSSGAMLEPESPMYVLRKKLLDSKINKVPTGAAERFAITIKAWNLFRTGKTLKMLYFNPDREEIPTPQ